MVDVRKMLTGEMSVPLQPQQRHPLEVLIGRWEEAEVVQAFGPLLADPEARIRAAAVHFFQRTAAPDRGAILAALRAERALFAGVRSDWYGEDTDLRGLLCSALAKRCARGDEGHVLLQQEALEHGWDGGMIGALARLDPRWVEEHAAALVGDDPEALYTLMRYGSFGGVQGPAVAGRVLGPLDEAAILGGGGRRGPPPPHAPNPPPREAPPPTTPPPGLLSQSARTRVETAEQVREPCLAEALCRLSAAPLEGSDDLSGFADGESPRRQARSAKRAVARACRRSLVALAETELGVVGLLRAALSSNYGHAEAATRALRHPTHAANVQSTLLKLLALSPAEVELATRGLQAAAVHFEGIEALPGVNKPAMPPLLAWAKAELRPKLRTLSAGATCTARAAKRLLKSLRKRR